MRAQAEAVAGELLKGKLSVEPGKRKVVETRRQVETAWRTVGDMLTREGQVDLATQVRRFVDAMPPARTDKERIAAALLETIRPRKVERTFAP